MPKRKAIKSPRPPDDPEVTSVLGKPGFHHDAWDGQLVLDIPRPSMFQPDPLVVGSSELARLVKGYLDAFPGIKARTGKVTSGPNRGTMLQMAEAGLPIDAFTNTNLLGSRARSGGEIALNPKLNLTGPNDEYTQEGVLAHELSHTFRADDEVPEKVRKAVQRKRRSQ